jgi:hypothetical protein
MKQQNQLETPGLLVKPLREAVPDVCSHDNHPPNALIRFPNCWISRAARFYPQLFSEGGQRREHFAAKPNTKLPSCMAAALDVAKA